MKKKHNKKRKIFIITLLSFIIFDLVFLIIITLPFTMAFFESSADIIVDTSVAKWSFLVNGKTTQEEVKINLENTLNEGNKKIIPGSSGVITLDLDASESDVSVRSIISINRFEIPNNLKIYNDEEYTEEITENIITKIKYHERIEKKLYWKWLFTDKDEKEWMDKEIKIGISVIGEQILDENEFNNLFESGTLAYNIYKNAKDVSLGNETTNTTKLSNIPETKPAQEESLENERTLSETEDDYGASYYFRGNIQDNFLNFNNMCWRIVRIEGDGSIKLILQDKTSVCNENTDQNTENAFIGVSRTFGAYYDKDYNKINDYIIQTYTDSPRIFLENWLNENFNQTELEKLKEEDWNFGNMFDTYNDNGTSSTTFAIPNYSNMYNGSTMIRLRLLLLKNKYASLKSESGDFKYKSKVGMLTADEVAFSGAIGYSNIYKCLAADNTFRESNYYLFNTSRTYLLSSYGGLNGYYQYGFYHTKFGEVCAAQNVNNWYGLDPVESPANQRPSVVLKNGIKIIGGNGTKENPYLV